MWSIALSSAAWQTLPGVLNSVFSGPINPTSTQPLLLLYSHRSIQLSFKITKAVRKHCYIIEHEAINYNLVHGRMELMICAASSESSQLRIIVCVWSAVGTCIPSASVWCTWIQFTSWKCHHSTSKRYMLIQCSASSCSRSAGGVVGRIKEVWVIPLGGFTEGSSGRWGCLAYRTSDLLWSDLLRLLRSGGWDAKMQRLPLVPGWFQGTSGAMLISQLVRDCCTRQRSRSLLPYT